MRPLGVEARLAHLDRRVLEVVDLRRLLEDVRRRDGERLPEPAVEPLREVAGQLDVLALVLAHRDLVGLVEQDVRDLEDRVGEEADGGPVGALLGGLVLELRHPRGLAEAGEAVHHPAELGVLGHMALDEERAPLRVQAGREQLGHREPGVGPQLGGVLRHGDRVQVHDHVEGVVRLLERHPLAHRAQVVAEVERAGGGLDPGEHTGAGGRAGAARLRLVGGERGAIRGHGPIVSGAEAIPGSRCGAQRERTRSGAGPLTPRERAPETKHTFRPPERAGRCGAGVREACAAAQGACAGRCGGRAYGPGTEAGVRPERRQVAGRGGGRYRGKSRCTGRARRGTGACAGERAALRRGLRGRARRRVKVSPRRM